MQEALKKEKEKKKRRRQTQDVGSVKRASQMFGMDEICQLVLLFSLFLLLFMDPTVLFILFMGSIVLFQLIFTFIYSTFSKKFSVSVK